MKNVLNFVKVKYKFTENKVELTTAIGTKWWDATDTSDYVLLERSYNTNYNLTVKHKSKNEYQTARNDSFDLLFGYMAKHEDKFTKTEAGNYKTTPGDPVVHTVGGTQIQYDDVIIYVEDGKIVWAEFAPERPIMYLYKTVKEINANKPSKDNLFLFVYFSYIHQKQRSKKLK